MWVFFSRGASAVPNLSRIVSLVGQDLNNGPCHASTPSRILASTGSLLEVIMRSVAGLLSSQNFLVLAVAASVTLVPAAPGSVDEGYQLSTFSADVRPPPGHPLPAGWHKPAGSIKERLEARGLVLFGPTAPIVVVTVDWCELRNDSCDRWRDVLADTAGTEGVRVLPGCIHQHDTPCTGLEAQWLLDKHGLLTS